MLRNEPSVVDIFLQELDEELLAGPERETNYKALVQRLENLEGTLRYLGYAVDLLRPRVDILLMFEPSICWWKSNRGRMRMNWEFGGQPMTVRNAKDVAKGEGGHYVPATVAAAHLAIKARECGR